METNLSRSSLTSRQDQKIIVGGRLIKGILLRNELRPSQPSSFVQPESRVEPLEAENFKCPPRPANTRAGKDYQVPGTNSEKQERRPRNKDRPYRVMWTPLRRSDGSSISEDQLSSSTGSTRHSGRRVGARNRKEESFALTGEGKSSRRGGGGGGPSSHEKQMWIQKSSSDT